MEIPDLKNWKVAFLLSIIVPVSLIATFKREPLTISEIINLSPEEWIFERPDSDVHINHRLDAVYEDNELLVNFVVVIGIYQENNVAYDGNDLITMRVEINATSIKQNVHVENVYIIFGKDYANSKIDWLATFFETEGLSFLGWSSGWSLDEKYEKAYANLNGINQPREVSFSASLVWSLVTPNNQSHQTQLTCEIAYYNGTVYKKMVKPYDLTIRG